MDDDEKIIYLDEERLKSSIEIAEEAIFEAKRLILGGLILPDGLLERLISIKDNLEKKLFNLIEGIEEPEE